MKAIVLTVSFLLSCSKIVHGFNVSCGVDSTFHSVPVGGSITLRCKADAYYAYCRVHVGNQICQFDWSKWPYSGVKRGECVESLKTRLSFVGKTTSSTFECAVRLDQVSMTDSGQWRMEVKEYSNPQKVKMVDMTVTVVSAQMVATRSNFTGDASCIEVGINYAGGDLPGTPIRGIASREDCQMQCQQSFTCKYWAYNSAKDCYLKNEESLKLRRIGDNVVSGSRYCPACFRFEQALGGNAVSTIWSSSFLDCQTNCKSTRKCQFFSYTESKCKLMSSGVGAQQQLNSVLGPAECPKARWSEWTEWSQPCQGVCDQGTQSRARKCYKDEATAQCEGSDQDIETAQQECTLSPCASESPGGSSSSSNTSSSPPTNWVSIGIPVVIILLLGVILGLLFKNRKRFMEKPGGNNWLVLYAKTKSSVQSSGNSNSSTRPIPINKFRDELRHRKIPTRDEFSQLDDEDRRKHVLMFPNEIGKKYNVRGSANMNRYANILPYDKNRVILKRPINGCDYVNASWIQNGNLGVKFIAAQGPLPQTVQHFLQMLVENNVKMVIMLTKIEERDSNGATKRKCEEYWAAPGSSKTYVSIVVETISEEEIIKVPGVIKRICQITTNVNGQPHQFTQYQFSSWPDFGVPEQSKPLIDLVQLVRRSHFGNSPPPPPQEQPQQPPILVHCSAGVGRTGTFMGLFGIMGEIGAKAKVIDVYKTVLNMRRDRVQMVQKNGQYKFLHECVACYLRHVDGTNDHMQSDYIYSL